MENKAAAFFVSEDEYPKLQVACPGDFPRESLVPTIGAG
jgi:hypothetical protein